MKWLFVLAVVISMSKAWSATRIFDCKSVDFTHHGASVVVTLTDTTARFQSDAFDSSGAVTSQLTSLGEVRYTGFKELKSWGDVAMFLDVGPNWRETSQVGMSLGSILSPNNICGSGSCVDYYFCQSR